ncbi:MAG: hypothetical protein ACRCY4_05725 [Brevinema sp.]
MSPAVMAIVIFCVLELSNVIILFFAPNFRQGNGVAVFNDWHEAQKQPSMALFTRYLCYWVAGVKLIFIALLVVVVLTGTPTTHFWALVALIASIASYFWRLHPIICRLDSMDMITPKGYSKTLGRTIALFLVMFSIALVLTLIR